MGAHRLVADRQLPGDGDVAEAARQQLQHAQLAHRQGLQRAGRLLLAGSGADIAGKMLVAIEQRLHRGLQLVGVFLLADEAAGARLPAACGEVAGVLGGQHQDSAWQAQAGHALDDFQSAEAGYR
ncbi:hypothetical protein D3C78_1566280 [compost metagenome]